METEIRNITLDETVCYEIMIAGYVEADWSDWIAAEISTETETGLTTSRISGAFDQAALQGALRRLYSHGFALISVNRTEESGGTR
jgi:hypothetical protein